MRKIEINNEKVNKIAKFACAFYCVYCICYIVAGAITIMVLYKDQIVAFVKKVGALLRRMTLKFTCFFKRVEDKLHPKKDDYSWLKEAMKDAPVVHLSDLERFDNDPTFGVEFDYSEE